MAPLIGARDLIFMVRRIESPDEAASRPPQAVHLCAMQKNKSLGSLLGSRPTSSNPSTLLAAQFGMKNSEALLCVAKARGAHVEFQEELAVPDFGTLAFPTHLLVAALFDLNNAYDPRLLAAGNQLVGTLTNEKERIALARIAARDGSHHVITYSVWRSINVLAGRRNTRWVKAHKELDWTRVEAPPRVLTLVQLKEILPDVAKDIPHFWERAFGKKIPRDRSA